MVELLIIAIEAGILATVFVWTQETLDALETEAARANARAALIASRWAEEFEAYRGRWETVRLANETMHTAMQQFDRIWLEFETDYNTLRMFGYESPSVAAKIEACRRLRDEMARKK